MTGYSASTFFLVLALISGPSDCIFGTPNEQLWDLVDEIKAVAKEMQLMDYDVGNGYEYQTWYYQEQSQDELERLQITYSDLKDIPRVENFHGKFVNIPEDRINNFLNFNREFQEKLKERMRWEHDRLDILLPVYDETVRLRMIWNEIQTINASWTQPAQKRYAYKMLMQLLPKEEFEIENDKLPDFVPTWCFREVKK